MGQAWCKEKSAKAQDSKSPLDRVFVRCAHKIYPGLKEDGSCLGAGAAQRVTSGSAPRKQLQRGQSIDSVDRPFHPSEWVDVNLEVACEPLDSALFDAANQRSSSYLSRLNGVSSASVGLAAPVPPPRRRRQRRPRFQSNNDNANNASPQFDASRSTESIDDDGTRDSDDEFVALERSLEKSSEVIRASPTRPKKNRSTFSLPELPEEELEEEAKRPPRHMKTTSLPHDTSLFVFPQQQQPQTPERLFNADQRIDEAAGDNSIFKIDQAEDVKTSTPVKAQPHADAQVDPFPSSSFNLHDAFHSCNDQSGESRDSSSQRQPSASDMGYESRSSYLFAERSNDDREEQLSSGILGDALVEPSIELPDKEVIIMVVQRSLSNESLPCQMLIEEIDDDEDEAIGEKAEAEDGEKSQIVRQSGELAKQVDAQETFQTPPPSPELKSQPIVENGVHGDTALVARQLDSALNAYVDKEEEKSPEPHIVPITRDRNTANEEMSDSNRLVDFHHRRDRRNPFDDSRNDEIDPAEMPPEKPSRLQQRSSLIEESAIEASLIVPTPPRRRHRSHHRSSSNLDDRHNDRLI
ncbi:uncharacterized protein LOC131663861 isoform X2 [Phymastichus coffea]|uniref:uncharacterized protein LOC131663861 isoform X2 n=1 Tax=Phymastichus coffea TaxID=108790 RepID=UPI00273CC191|nr:uncharacterized protein LOC131663861 isoform X2 [Phymastichus coffea]